jgi:DNA repair exonuclease SbcCD ATPase subunit
MAESFTIKRAITIRAVVTPRWKEDAERELSNALSNLDGQLAQLEQEGQRVITEVRSQSANPLDPRVQEQVASIQQQVAAKRAELEEQGQLESFCEVRPGDNLVEKMQASILVRDGVVESLEGLG